MRPFDNLRDALSADGDLDAGQAVRSDPDRMARTGTPEVIYAARKSIEQIVAGIEDLIGHVGRVVISQLQPGAADALRLAIADELLFTLAPGNRAGLVARPDAAAPVSGGRVAVISAGTSDVPVAAEAALIAAEMGCAVRTTWDVGVAGIHRLVRPLEAMTTWDADVFIVAAGMDGILPTVVCGLVPQPVIGLPISSGYGFGGQGIGALTTMLQTCSPGIAVVNIDNGIGAGITAARIANQAAKGRVASDPSS
jgi:pyridinium-3,5-biscarboxylic acid mononucleotide synthase